MAPILPKLQTKKTISLLGASSLILCSIWGAQRVSAQHAMPSASTPTSTVINMFDAPAPERISFIISPPRMELSGKPGETLQVSLKVKNITDQTQTFRSEVFDYVVGQDGSTPQEVSETVPNRWSAKKWMTITPSTTAIPSNGTQTVTALIQIPEDALPGGHYAMVLHSPVVPTSAGFKSAATVESRSGTLLYITVAGSIREEAFVNNVKAPKWVEYGPVAITYSVDNQSDLHIAPQSTLTVRDVFGRIMSVTKVPTKNIFPYLSKDFETSYENFLGIGPFSATIEAAYGNSGKIARGVTQFWMFPYRLFLSAVVLLSSLTAILISIRRHIQHRNNAQTQQIEILEERIKELEGRNKERRRRE